MDRLKLLYGGLKSYLPTPSYTMAATEVDAQYGYAVWLRHMVMLARHGVTGPFATVAELGPGNSIATGVAALLSGTQRYVGLDVLEHIAGHSHVRVMEDVLQLFQRQADIPHGGQYPTLCPSLDDYRFPAALLAGSASAVNEERRSNAIRAAVEALTTQPDSSAKLRYVVPWQPDSLPAGSVDLIFTQAVLQEIPHGESAALRNTIATMAAWLRPGGVMSHQIDLGIYGLEPWNAHWTWSELQWKLIRGRRDNFVNREPLSTYETLFRECGLQIIGIDAAEGDGAETATLAPRYAALPERERRTRAVILIARKPA